MPSELDEITLPTAYVWSTDGTVSAESVETVTQGGPEQLSLLEADVWKAHLQSIPTVIEAVESVGS